MKPNIRILTPHYPGYGGRGQWFAIAVCDNRKLEELECCGSFDQGAAYAKLLAKWDREWDEAEFVSILSAAPLASTVCDVCGGDTLDGWISCVNKTFCKKCEPHVDKYREEYQKEVARVEEQRRVAAEEREKRRVEDINRRVAEARFHWSRNWYFTRLPDGSVNIFRLNEGKYIGIGPDLIIPANEWASIVASVSAGGETGERWVSALNFHG